ncbi:MAG: TIGR02117 family protein [Pseudomonadota bacterium]|nr:TIGR02117 family protein [Pseudomonadota bacterium]
MAKRKRRSVSWPRRLLLALAAVPALYLLAALLGSLIPVNPGWREPSHGITIYLADNGVHADLVLPVLAQGLDWAPLVPRSDMADASSDANWIAFGAGERRVYLDTPTWADISLATLWAAITGGERVIHAEYTADPAYAARAIRVTPEQYRRLWTAIRAEFRLDSRGRPVRIDHPGYGPRDAFYEGVGRASALSTCNNWVAGRLRLAGVKASLWPPFAQGLLWRYRDASE